MQINVIPAGHGRFSHLIQLEGLVPELTAMGLRLSRVATGTASMPAVLVSLDRGPTSAVTVDPVIHIRLIQDFSHPNLNARIAFDGLRRFLESTYGLTATESSERGRGSEIALRAFLPDFDGEYIPSDQGWTDMDGLSDQSREMIMRAIAIRRGAQAFRQRMRTRFGDRCVVTGCTVVDVLEAAHIRPYRTPIDNDPTNGLLLRADIHTLFDLDLFGIELQTLKLHFHPQVMADYGHLEGTELKTNQLSLDQAALALRWSLFMARLNS